MSSRMLVAVLSFCAVAGAAVRSVHVVERTDVLNGQPMGSAGPYERIVARVNFTVDPKLPANRIISDIDLAARDDDAMVSFSSDLYVLKPRDPRQGNGTVLFEVSNRGRKGMISMFNMGPASLDPASERDFGDRFLLERGFTLVWLGWQHDVPPQQELMRLHAPVATWNGRPITGIVRAEFVPDSKIFSHSLADRNHAAYAVINPDDPAVRLTVRDRCDAERRVIPRAQWSFARFENLKAIPDPTHVYMASGFEPGKIYEVVYQARNPALAGLGPAAIRDFISFLKYGTPDGGITLLGDQRSHIKRAIGFGTSQSGRLLRTFLYYGFNRDERDRRVFDGVWAHVAGAGRGSFNHRFAQPSRDGHPHMNCQYPTDIYPFSDLAQKDSVTGLDEGLLSRAEADKVAPKIMYTNSSYEYWGRSASLVHTSIDGRQDFGPSKDTRVYLFAGTQHGPGAFPPQIGNGQNLNNANDYRWPMRALLAAFQDWLATGKEPPASLYPLVGKDQLVPPSALAFPKVPGVALPARQQKAYRADYGSEFRTAGIVTREPPALGAAFPTLVPQVDSDGNETSGIRLPVVAVPLATLTGWNLRRLELGAPEELFSMVGSTIPFARTAADRKKAADPRPSIEERYESRADYLAKFEAAARELAKSGYVLEGDVEKIVVRGAAMWDAWAGGGR
jgi:hypothetical protein